MPSESTRQPNSPAILRGREEERLSNVTGSCAEAENKPWEEKGTEETWETAQKVQSFSRGRLRLWGTLEQEIRYYQRNQNGSSSWREGDLCAINLTLQLKGCPLLEIVPSQDLVSPSPEVKKNWTHRTWIFVSAPSHREPLSLGSYLILKSLDKSGRWKELEEHIDATVLKRWSHPAGHLSSHLCSELSRKGYDWDQSQGALGKEVNLKPWCTERF